MIVEVIAVGTELLLGEIVNTNAADIGTRLAEDGFDIHHQVTVGDNRDRLVSAIELACARADAVVLTGGIGPTQDDMTRDAICAVLGVGIATDADHAEAIRARLAERGVVADSALRMADYPEGSEPLPNRKGVALGIGAEYEGTPIFAVPGVPVEMRAMIDDEVRPRLRAASGDPAVLSSRLLHCWGLGESQIAERLDDLYASTNPSVAFLIDGPEVRVRITAKAGRAEETAEMIATVEHAVRDRLGPAVFATDDETVDAIVADMVADRGWTIASVEAATGGMVAARLSAMDAFVGGTVTATNGATEATADVKSQALDMLRAHADDPAHVLVAVSEVSGQGRGAGTAGRQIGVAIRSPTREVITALSVLGDDERARRFAVPGALHLLRLALAE